MKALKKISMCFYIFVLILLDQISKIYVIKNVQYNSIDIIKNILRFTYCENRGGAFSFATGNVWLFIIANLIIISSLIIYYERNKKTVNLFEKICVTMIIAGGTSNLIDRIFRGYVVDFIDINQLFNYAIFNIADMFIVVGIAGWIMYMLFGIVKREN